MARRKTGQQVLKVKRNLNGHRLKHGYAVVMRKRKKGK